MLAYCYNTMHVHLCTLYTFALSIQPLPYQFICARIASIFAFSKYKYQIVHSKIKVGAFILLQVLYRYVIVNGHSVVCNKYSTVSSVWPVLFLCIPVNVTVIVVQGFQPREVRTSTVLNLLSHTYQPLPVSILNVSLLQSLNCMEN